MINVRKILLICLMIAVFALLVYTVVKGVDISGYEVLAANYAEQNINGAEVSLRPYEAMILYRAE